MTGAVKMATSPDYLRACGRSAGLWRIRRSIACVKQLWWWTPATHISRGTRKRGSPPLFDSAL